MECCGSTTISKSGAVEIAVTAVPKYCPQRAGDDDYYSYTITIENRGAQAVRLLSRRWVITDGDNQVKVVEGEGVIGQTPRIESGQAFVYTSYVCFATPVGYMHGCYIMTTDAGEHFEAAIDVFMMARPNAIQ